MATQLKLNQLQQEGASTNNVIAWNGSTWAPASNGSGTVTSVAATQPSAGFTISGSPITSSGTLTFALSDDLAAVEGLSSNGIAVRTGTSTWNTRSIAVTSNADSTASLAVGNADGVSGNPTLNVLTHNSTFKLSVEAATTANLASLSGLLTVDGITLTSGNRVLVKNQTTGSQNGIWAASSGSWTRATDYDADTKAEHSLIVYVQDGTTNGNKYFKVDQKKPIIGTTALTFTEILGSTGDGNGIYSGSGNIGSAAVATVASGSTFTIDYNGGNDAFRVSDSASSTYIKSKDGNQGVTVDNSSTLLTAGSNSVTLSSTGFDVATGVGGPYINTDSTAINLSKSSVSMVLNASSIGFVAPYFSFGGHDSTTAAEIRLFEPSTSGSNYTAFKTQAQSADITYILPATNANGLLKNSSSTLSWGTASNTELASGTGGIYKGSGTIPASTVATLTAASSFKINNSSNQTRFRIDENINYYTLGDSTAASAACLEVNGTSYAGMLTGNNFARLETTGFTVRAPYWRVYSADADDVPGEIRLYEKPLSTGFEYTGIKAADTIAASHTYTLPNALPGTTGYVLSSDTSGVMSWVANGSADGNGIYSGSGTIASGAVATVTSGSSFTIDYNGGNNAISVSDSVGSITLGAKTASTGFIGIDSSGVGVYSGSDLFTLIESNGGAELNTDLRIYNGKLLLDSVSSPAQFTANQNNYSLSATAAVLRVSTDASRNLTGIANSGTMQDGRVLTIVNVGSFNLVLTTEDTNSTAANRFALGESNATLKSSESITLWYDTTTDRWRPIDYRASTSGVTDHGALGGLSDDDHSQYALLAGRSTGQILTGGTASGDDLTLRSTTNATKGDVILNDQGGNVIIGGAATASELRFMEPSGSGTEYTAFVAAAQAASQTYILPTDAPSNGEFLRWNTGGQLDWAAASGGSGDINNGGNTTGAAITIGTNDAFDLNFETSGVTRMSITGGASTGGAVTVTNVTANTNTVQDVLTLRTNSTGTAAASFGPGILLQAESSTTDNQDLARIAGYWTTATHASREGALSFQLGDNGGALAEIMKLDRTTSTGILSIGSTTPVTISNTGITNNTGFTFGGSANLINLGGSSGAVQIYTTSASTQAILIAPTANSASSNSGISVGGGNSYTQTSGTRNMMHMEYTFAPTSGTAVNHAFAVQNTVNQTGGANGITRGIYVNPTLTAIADYRGIDIAYSNSTAKGIYQSGANTTNNFVGRTSFGTTSAPNASALIDIVTTSLGLGLPAMTSTQRDAISSPRQGLVVHNTTDDKISVRRSSD